MQNTKLILIEQSSEDDELQYFRDLPFYYQKCIESDDNIIRNLGFQGLNLLEKYFSHLLD